MSNFNKMLMTRISAEEAKIFAENCKQRGLSMSAVVREFIIKFNRDQGETLRG